MKLAGVGIAVAIALSSFTAPSGAASRPTLSDPEARLLNEAPEASFGDWMGLVPIGRDGKEALIDFWKQMFQDPEFMAATERWVRGRYAENNDDLLRQWVDQFGRVIAPGLYYWNDDEITKFLQSSFLHPMANPKVCVTLSANQGLPATEQAAAMQIEPEDLASLVRTIRRAYLAGQAKEAPRPMPTWNQRAEANRLVLPAMSAKDSERLHELLDPKRGPLPVQDKCEVAALHMKAVLALKGEPGVVVRRSYFMFAARKLLGAIARPTTRLARDAVQFEFTPGSLHYPPLASEAGLEGRVRMVLWIDEQGSVIRARTVLATLNKPAVRVGGKDVPSYKLLEPAAAAFYQAGRFKPHYENGEPVPYETERSLVWQLTAPGRTYKEVFGPTGRELTLAMTVPTQWEDTLTEDKPQRLRVTSSNATMAIQALSDKAPETVTLTLESNRPFLDKLPASLENCEERDMRSTPVASEWEGEAVFCTDTKHDPSNPKDYKYNYKGIVRIAGTYVYFDYLSNEEKDQVRPSAHDLFRKVKFYETVYATKP